MELITAINRRRSARKFLPQSPERDQILPIMEAARFAHSIANRQVLRYSVILNKVKSRHISDYVNLCSNTDKEEFAPPSAYIICCGPEGDSPSLFADVGTAFQNMSLAAMTEKLSMCFITQFDSEQIKQQFELENGYKILAIFALGYAAESSVAYNAETLPEHIENASDSRIIQIPKLRASQITTWIE